MPTSRLLQKYTANTFQQLNLSALLTKKLVLITGKGGIGKTSMAAGLGQLATNLGKNVLIIEQSAEDQIAPLFGLSPIGHHKTKIFDNGFAININHRDNFRDYIINQLGFGHLFEKVFSHNLVKSFLEMVPGLSELMLLGRLYYESLKSDSPKFDLVIFDSFASGHFLSLMTTPDAILKANLVGPIMNETLKVKDFLRNQQLVATLMVTTAEELVITECKEFVDQLVEKSPAYLSGIVINRVPFTLLESDTDQILQSNSSSALSSYCLEEINRWLKNFELLMKQLQENSQGNKYDHKIAFFPDLGAISEPLAGDFYKNFKTDQQSHS